jgi:general secretion pathway protein G
MTTRAQRRTPAFPHARTLTAGNARRRNSRGFSLLEIVLVLAIIGVLLAVVAVNVGGFGQRGKIRATEASMRTIKTVLDTYHLEYSAYPPTLATLQTINPPMLPTQNTLQDGWNMPFHYKPGQNSKGQPYELISFGGAPEWDPAIAIDVWTIGQN